MPAVSAHLVAGQYISPEKPSPAVAIRIPSPASLRKSSEINDLSIYDVYHSHRKLV